jgi:hypothetical protein
MTALVTFLSNEEYDKKNWDIPYAAPTTAPSVASASR